MLLGAGPRLALSTSLSVVIGGKSLNCASEYKYIGVVLAAPLMWNVHVEYLIVKVKKRLGKT